MFYVCHNNVVNHNQSELLFFAKTVIHLAPVCYLMVRKLILENVVILSCLFVGIQYDSSH